MGAPWTKTVETSGHRQFAFQQYRLTVCKLLNLAKHNAKEAGKYNELHIPPLDIAHQGRETKHLVLDACGRHFATVDWADARINAEAIQQIVSTDCSAPLSDNVGQTNIDDSESDASSAEDRPQEPATTSPRKWKCKRSHEFRLSPETRCKQVAAIRLCAKHILGLHKSSTQLRIPLDNLLIWAATLALPAHTIKERQASQVGTIHFRLRLNSKARFKEPHLNRAFVDNLPLTGPYLFGRQMSRTLLRMRQAFAFGHSTTLDRYKAIYQHPSLQGIHLPILQRQLWARPVHIQRQIKARGLALASPWSSLAVNMPAQETSMKAHTDRHDATWGICTIVSSGCYSGGALNLHPAGLRILTRPTMDIICFPSAKLLHSNERVHGYRMSIIGFTSADLLKKYSTTPELSDYPVWNPIFWSEDPGLT